MAGSGVRTVKTFEGIDVALLGDDDLAKFAEAAERLGLRDGEAYLPLGKLIAYARTKDEKLLGAMLSELESLARELRSALNARSIDEEQADRLLEELGKAISGIVLVKSVIDIAIEQ